MNFFQIYLSNKYHLIDGSVLITNTNTNLLNALPVNVLINEAIRIEVEKNY